MDNRNSHSILLNHKIYATFERVGDKLERYQGILNLPELCLKLLSDQKKAWQDLRVGCESLIDVLERDLPCKGFSVRLQYNPGRIKSSTAHVGGKTSDERPCFLCLNHLPKSQKGILYQNQYLILCNPMPVFSSHFTVSHLDHRGQAIAEDIATFLRLAIDFGSGWTVLYNGPKCGASAPNHLHFQVTPSGQIPIERELRGEERFVLKKKIDGVFLYRVRDLGREVLILEGDDPMALGDTFNRLLGGLKKVLLLNEEPMINMIGFQDKRNWRLVIFPRQKHRPHVFYKEGEARVVVSPGVIDMAGLVITPIEKDFERLDPLAVESIYREVSLDEKTVGSAIRAMG